MPIIGASVAPRRMLLMLLVAVGFALRLWNLPAGLPDFPYPDEPTHLGIAARAGIGGLNPHFFGYPTVWPYLLLSTFGAFFVASRVAGRFESLGDFESLYFTDPTTFFVLGRALTAVLGSTTIVLVYLLGRRLATRRAGLIAAAIVAVAPLHVYYSRYMVGDTALTFAVVGAFLLIVRTTRIGSGAAQVFAALATGLAISVKYSAAPIIAPLFGAVLSRAWRPESRVRALLAVARVSLLVGVGFVAGTPFALLAVREFVAGARWPLTYAFVGDPGFDPVGNGLMHLLVVALPYSVGPLVAMLAIAGFALATVDAARHRVVPLLLAAAFVVPYLTIVGLSATPFIRYLLPVLPFAAVYAAWSVERVARPLRLGPPWSAVATVLVFGLVVAEPLIDSVRWLASLSLPDTRSLARQWLEQHATEGDVIVTEVYGPPLAKSRDQWRSELDQLSRLAVHDPEAARQLERSARKYRVLSRQPETRPTFTVYVLNRAALRDRMSAVFDVPYAIEAVHERRARYVVLSVLADRMRRDPRRYADAVRFYDTLERQSTPAITLDPLRPDCAASGRALRDAVIEELDPRCRRFNGPPLTIFAVDRAP